MPPPKPPKLRTQKWLKSDFRGNAQSNPKSNSLPREKIILESQLLSGLLWGRPQVVFWFWSLSNYFSFFGVSGAFGGAAFSQGHALTQKFSERRRCWCISLFIHNYRSSSGSGEERPPKLRKNPQDTGRVSLGHPAAFSQTQLSEMEKTVSFFSWPWS